MVETLKGADETWKLVGEARGVHGGRVRQLGASQLWAGQASGKGGEGERRGALRTLLPLPLVGMRLVVGPHKRHRSPSPSLASLSLRTSYVLLAPTACRGGAVRLPPAARAAGGGGGAPHLPVHPGSVCWNLSPWPVLQSPTRVVACQLPACGCHPVGAQHLHTTNARKVAPWKVTPWKATAWQFSRYLHSS